MLNVEPLCDFRGAVPANHLFPEPLGGRGPVPVIRPRDKILESDQFIIERSGDLGGVAACVGDSLLSLKDDPGQDCRNWLILPRQLLGVEKPDKP